MKLIQFTSVVLAACATMTLGLRAAASRERTPAGAVPVHVVVTVEARRGAEVPDIRPQDVTVRQGKERVQVTDWVPLRGERAGLELFVLLDDALRPVSLGPQLEDLQRFINSQPETAAIGIGYMRDGAVDIAYNRCR